MLTKYLLTAAFMALVGLLFFKGRGRAAPRPPQQSGEPRVAETIRCPNCGAWHLTTEPCLCGQTGPN